MKKTRVMQVIANGLSASEAAVLVARLTVLGLEHGVSAAVEGDRIVFLGGPNGSHSLAFDVSSEARVLAHWQGYLEHAAARTNNRTERFTVTTASGGVLASYFSTLAGAYAYADECNAMGWSGLQIRDQWTDRVVSRA